MVTKDFDAMNSQEKCDVVTNAANELAYKFLYEQDRVGLDLLVERLQAQITIVRDCVDCLNFINSPRGRVFEKIHMLIDIIGNSELAENAVKSLEEIAEHARSNLEEADVTPEGIAKGVRNIKQVMLQHLNEAECGNNE